MTLVETTADFVAFDRQSVDQFFLDAFEARRRLLAEIDETEGRIVAAEAALAGAGGDDYSAVETVLEGQRRLRAEARANERAMAALAEYAEASAARILAAARTDSVAAGRSDSGQSRRGCSERGSAEPINGAASAGASASGSGRS